MDLLARLNQAYTSDSDESDSSSQEMIKPKKDKITQPLAINPAPEVDVSDLVAD